MCVWGGAPERAGVPERSWARRVCGQEVGLGRSASLSVPEAWGAAPAARPAGPGCVSPSRFRQAAELTACSFSSACFCPAGLWELAQWR